MKRHLFSAAIVALVGVGQAQADLITFCTVGGAPTGVARDNLDWLTLGTGGGTNPDTLMTVAFEGDGQVVQGSVVSQYAAPFISGLNGDGFGNIGEGLDTTPYVSSGSMGATGGAARAVFTFATPQQYFGLLWGSADDYNTLSFFDGAIPVGSITGSDVLALLGEHGEHETLGKNGTMYVNINSTLPFDRVLATSANYAFEVDNIAFNETQVPEPASLALIGMGLLGLGWRSRRRK
jgi:PEP-CTERM motif